MVSIKFVNWGVLEQFRIIDDKLIELYAIIKTVSFSVIWLYLYQNYGKILFVIDYDYDFYGYSDYRGGYTEPYYEDYYRRSDGDYFDFPASGMAPATMAGPRYTSRSNSVGFGLNQILKRKIVEKLPQILTIVSDFDNNFVKESHLWIYNLLFNETD